MLLWFFYINDIHFKRALTQNFVNHQLFGCYLQELSQRVICSHLTLSLVSFLVTPSLCIPAVTTSMNLLCEPALRLSCHIDILALNFVGSLPSNTVALGNWEKKGIVLSILIAHSECHFKLLPQTLSSDFGSVPQSPHHTS